MRGDDEMVRITGKDGRIVGWVTRPPAACPQGHPFRAGDITTYSEGWYACGCDAAEAADERPGHSRYTCKRCGTTTDVPRCTDPSLRVGWAADHGSRPPQDSGSTALW